MDTAWMCPVCEEPHSYLSRLSAHVRDEHPDENVRLLSTTRAAREAARAVEADPTRGRPLLRSVVPPASSVQGGIVDPLTGLGNRRAWLEALMVEEDRCRRHGATASVVLIGLDETQIPESDVLPRAARLVASRVRADDVVVRLGPGEFGVLAVQCAPGDGEILAERLVEAIDAEHLPARIGVGARRPNTDLHRAWEEAEMDLRRSRAS